MQIILLPLLNGLGKTFGTELAGEAILKTLKKSSLLSENGKKPAIKESSIAIDNSNLEESHAAIARFFEGLDHIPLILGGDHSLTYPCFKAFSRRFSNPGIIVFDAHPDVVNDFHLPTHEDFLRMLIEDGLVADRNVILFGIRAIDEIEQNFLRRTKVRQIPMREIYSEGLDSSIETMMFIAKDFGAVYVSIDIDAIDPAFAPGTGYPEPGGLSSREFLHTLARLKNLKNLKAFDLVEVNPKKDINEMTIRLAAKIAGEILAY